MENINKDYTIYVLLGIVVLLSAYIVFEEPNIKTVVKTETETVVDEIIIYKDKECPSVNTASTTTNDDDLLIYEEKDKKDEFIIASTYDSKHSYQIFIFSYEKPIASMIFEKVVLNGKVKKDGEESIFILDVNKAILENMNEVYFKVKDKNTKKTYISRADCLYGLIENYIYHTNLEIFGDEITCDISEDRELDEKSKKNKISGMIKSNEIKGKFLNIKSAETKDF